MGKAGSLIADIDIWRSAKLLVDQYGADASLEAAIRCDAMLDAGDLDGQAVWKRIMCAVDALRNKTVSGLCN